MALVNWSDFDGSASEYAKWLSSHIVSECCSPSNCAKVVTSDFNFGEVSLPFTITIATTEKLKDFAFTKEYDGLSFSETTVENDDFDEYPAIVIKITKAYITREDDDGFGEIEICPYDFSFSNIDVKPVKKSIDFPFTVSIENCSVDKESPITLSEGEQSVITVSPNDGYYFAPSDRVEFENDEFESLYFTLNSAGNMTYVLTYNNADTFKDSNCVLTGSVTKGEPSPVVPTDIHSMFTVYAPSQDNIDTIDNAMFINYTTGTLDNPLSKIISFQRFYCDIAVEGICPLNAGNYKFNTNAPYVSQLKQKIDCGTVFVDEIYGSLIDYSPYTKVLLYLPFIGFNEMDAEKVIGHNIRLEYVVDVESGRCLAKVYSDIVEPETCIFEVGGIIASDEPLTNSETNYKGSYEMLTTMQLGDFIPYFQIDTKIPLGDDVSEYKGVECSEVIKVGDVHGYVKYDSINVSGINATQREVEEIKMLLLNGILVN